MFVVTSDTVSIPIEFLTPEGSLIVPETNSFSYSVTDIIGTVILPEQTPTLEDTATETIITLQSPITDKNADEDFKHLLVKYSYTYNRVVYSHQITLTIINEKKYVVSEQDVRNVLGADISILPDKFIDVHGAYIEVKQSSDIGDVDLDMALVNTSSLGRTANAAIKYYAALQVVISLDLRRVKSYSVDNITSGYFDKDIGSLKKKMQGLYYKAIQILNPELGTQLNQIPTPFTIVTPTPDPITGV